MSEKVKKGDVIELDYSGFIATTGELFDTTQKDVAEQHSKTSDNASYQPVIIKVGKGMVVRGLDEALVGKEVGKTYEVVIEAEKAFGRHDPKKIKIYMLEQFRKQNINPYPGMIITFENNVQAKVLSVSSGRVRVDFNHPLAGKPIRYVFKILRKVDDVKERFLGLFKSFVGIGLNEEDVEVKNKTLYIDEKYKDMVSFLNEFCKEFMDGEIEKVEVREREKSGQEDKK